MQIISGAMGKQKVHFEAPPSAIIPKEMNQFMHALMKPHQEAKKKLKKRQYVQPLRICILKPYTRLKMAMEE